MVAAIAMTEPAAGSDLQGIKTMARRDGDHYVINGSKTVITNGHRAATAEAAVAVTARYVKERVAFGKPLLDLQHTRLVLADCKTTAHVGRVFVDHCLEQLVAGQLDDTTAAMA